MIPPRGWIVPLLAALILIGVGRARAERQERLALVPPQREAGVALTPRHSETSLPNSRVPCWQARALLAYHGGNIPAARQAARARGYSEAQISDAVRRCLK